MGIGALAMAAGCGTDYDGIANLDSTGTNIICFGDSITYGHGASAGNDYPAQLSRMLGRPVLNAGKNGETTAGGLERLQKAVLARDPRIVVVGLGGNDFLSRTPKTQTARNLELIVQRCIRRGAMVVVVHSKFGILLSDPYLEEFRAIAERNGAVFVRDSLDGILGNPRRMSDPIHPNDEGYRLIAERVSEAVAPLIEAAERARAGV